MSCYFNWLWIDLEWMDANGNRRIGALPGKTFLAIAGGVSVFRNAGNFHFAFQKKRLHLVGGFWERILYDLPDLIYLIRH
jgi:hypothetical protein